MISQVLSNELHISTSCRGVTQAVDVAAQTAISYGVCEAGELLPVVDYCVVAQPGVPRVSLIFAGEYVGEGLRAAAAGTVPAATFAVAIDA